MIALYARPVLGWGNVSNSPEPQMEYLQCSLSNLSANLRLMKSKVLFFAINHDNNLIKNVNQLITPNS